jgi:predicted DNA-binding ribbon-helix-helix protein
MKTKNLHYRCDEKYYKAIEERAKRQRPVLKVSTLVSRIVSFFGEIESVNPWFWDELKEEARKRKVSMASLVTEHTQAALKPKKDDKANWTYSPTTDQI